MRRLLSVLVVGVGCSTPSNQAPEDSARSTATAAPPIASSAAISGSSAPSAAAVPSEKLPGTSLGCAEDMVRVTGDYCPAVMQDCAVHHKEWEANKDKTKTVSERCTRYEKPSRCVSKKRKELSFCMDRYEYPNKVGEKPQVLTQWTEAKKICEDAGKRLCTEDEFNFACEGPEILPYVYGFERSPEICNIDKPYRYPDHSKVMLTYGNCLKDDWCSAELARLDQREKIGDRKTCVSWAGVFDLNGNANEWVEIPNEKPPNRSGLKGGWWGPVRGRCRPTVTFHKESDYGYEAGFRCCADAKGSGATPP